MYRKERYLLMCTECNLFFPPSQFRYHVPQFRMCESCRLLNLDIVNYLERYVYTPRLLCCYSSFENRLDRIHRKCLALEKELDDLKERFARRDEEKACRKIYEVVNKKEEENTGNEKQDLKIKMKIVKKKNHKKVKFEVEENANQEETMQQVSPPKKIKLENMDGVEEEKFADEKEKKNPSKEEDDEMKEEKDVDNEKEQNVEEMVEQIIDEILKKSLI
ncbi:titin homolog [Drosophila willistoni]|uniref:titin homolog n=1 Tax=Drosophila willistoni TaxID=7260 RepID=UPI00017D7C2E|nr:titin homolog [Drosophila willistoni]